MNLFGLIGFPLSHSFSEKYFSEKFRKEKISDVAYKLFPIQNIKEFPSLIEQQPELAGLNVTIPYKEKVIGYLDNLDPIAKETGAVNTIRINRSADKPVLTGYNTDSYGFRHSLEPLLKPYHRKALILGTGGASKAVKYVLQKLLIPFISASIEKLNENEISYGDITQDILREYLIIINATPVGMFPESDACPEIPYSGITSRHILYDLIYNPDVTLFLKKGKNAGAIIINGLQMLHLQAEKSWEIWKTCK